MFWLIAVSTQIFSSLYHRFTILTYSVLSKVKNRDSFYFIGKLLCFIKQIPDSLGTFSVNDMIITIKLINTIKACLAKSNFCYFLLFNCFFQLNLMTSLSLLVSIIQNHGLLFLLSCKYKQGLQGNIYSSWFIYSCIMCDFNLYSKNSTLALIFFSIRKYCILFCIQTLLHRSISGIYAIRSYLIMPLCKFSREYYKYTWL